MAEMGKPEPFHYVDLNKPIGSEILKAAIYSGMMSTLRFWIEHLTFLVNYKYGSIVLSESGTLKLSEADYFISLFAVPLHGKNRNYRCWLWNGIIKI